jgi:predicted MFS family arabinose efflux permease
VLALYLWLLTISGWVEAWHLIAIQFFAGGLSSVAQSSRIALIPTLVPRDLLGQALAINSISFNLARFVGPAFAGIVIFWFGVATVFAINARSFLAFLFA